MTTRWRSRSNGESSNVSKNVLNRQPIEIEAKSVYSEQLLIVYMSPNFFRQVAIG